jgi:DnaK suppressor protein
MPGDVRARIERVRDRLRRLEAGVADGLAVAARDAAGELSQYDNHPADGATTTFGRELDAGLSQGLQERLHRVDRALAKLDDGTYGRCDRCGEPIPPERLTVEPEAIWCLRCANVMDPAYVPPARALAAQTGEQPPGVRDPVEATRRDFADALWQFGSSDSPQDLPDVVSYEDIGDTLGPPPGGVAAIETYVDEAGEVLQDTVRALPRRQGRSTQKASEEPPPDARP